MTVIPEGRGKRKKWKVSVEQLYHGLKWKKKSKVQTWRLYQRVVWKNDCYELFPEFSNTSSASEPRLKWHTLCKVRSARCLSRNTDLFLLSFPFWDLSHRRARVRTTAIRQQFNKRTESWSYSSGIWFSFIIREMCRAWLIKKKNTFCSFET